MDKRHILPTYSRIEETTADAEKDPGIDGERESKSQGYEEQRRGVGCLRKRPVTTRVAAGSSSIGNLRGGKGEEQEEKGS